MPHGKQKQPKRQIPQGGAGAKMKRSPVFAAKLRLGMAKIKVHNAEVALERARRVKAQTQPRTRKGR